MSEKVFWGTLLAVFVIARFALARSEWREQKGLCARCGQVPGTVALGGNHFCEPCSEVTRRGYKAASQFTGFLGVAMLIPMILTAFLSEIDSSLKREFLFVLTGIGVFYLWIRRSMVPKAPK